MDIPPAFIIEEEEKRRKEEEILRIKEENRLYIEDYPLKDTDNGD